MALTLRSPAHSFVQFGESSEVVSCQFKSFSLCLPVYLASDVHFQFYVDADTEVEAGNLCDLDNDLLEIGLTDDCGNDLMVTFPWKAERFKVGPKTLLYNCSGGLVGFDSVFSVGDCFIIKVLIQGLYETFEFCSNCLQRIDGVCHTSVLDYANEDNAFGFDYCAAVADDGSGSGGSGGSADCDPTFVQFTNQLTLSIPYTAALQAKYGDAPTVNVWIYDDSGVLVDAGLRIELDGFPPTLITINLGGSASGFVKIS